MNLGELDKRFTGTVTASDMVKAGLIGNAIGLIKVLAKGKLTKPLHVKASRFSAAAKSALEAAGGKAEVL